MARRGGIVFRPAFADRQGNCLQAGAADGDRMAVRQRRCDKLRRHRNCGRRSKHFTGPKQTNFSSGAVKNRFYGICEDLLDLGQASPTDFSNYEQPNPVERRKR